MTKEYDTITLGSEARTYVREQLQNGKSLGRNLLSSQDIGGGTIVTFLPKDTGPERANEFTTGGHASAHETLAWLAQTIRVHLAEAPESLCVLEDALARPSDPQLSRAAASIVSLNDEVYHVLSGDLTEESSVKQVIKQAQSLPTFIGALTSSPLATSNFLGAGHFTAEQLETLAARANAIVIGAYDGEGYLLWKKTVG